jgi:dihydroorotate dehydrogenase
LLYRLIRPLLFLFDAETVHRAMLAALRTGYALPGARLLIKRLYRAHVPDLPAQVMGLTLKNPIGLAAGLDKNAECPQAFADFGFGWLELGTVTPRPQPGNPRPRLFRLTGVHAIINRMGFNNAGLALLLDHLYRAGVGCPVGINIGKNKDTPNEQAAQDYLTALRAVYPHADYVTVNISSPNTPGLRELQGSDYLDALLTALKTEQAQLHARHGRYVPIALKIAPDLSDAQIEAIAALLLAHRFDAVIATNTTISRPALEAEPRAREAGGLSGRPLRPIATEVIRKLYRQLQGRVPIIGVGGIENADDAWEKLLAGAEALQIYSALIYQGPGVVRDIVAGLAARVRTSGSSTLAEAIAKARA